ncbi:MAG: ABC transporter permease [Acidobacteria bacterium]|nr:ABC transporter permease [Acidobacteriota bacterium]
MSWWKNLIARERVERDLGRELDFHVEERVSDLMKSGLDEEAARKKVRQEFGVVAHVREECADARSGRWLELLLRDLKHSLRGLRKQPVAALTTILTVAICVAVNTAVFTVVDSMLIRPLPLPDADRLVSMTNQYPKAGIHDQDSSAAGDYWDREGKLAAVSSHALYQPVAYPVDRGERPAHVNGMRVTPSLFSVLRVRPAQGRLFSESESEPGKDGVVILSDGFSKQMFGGSQAEGRELRISGRPYTVVGVLPAGFRFVDANTRFFVPLALSPQEKRGRHANNYRYIARLKDEATVAQAQAQVDALNARLLDDTPALKPLLLDAGFRAGVHPLQPWLMRRVRSSLSLLWAGALLVLVVGATNLAGLSLARAHARLPEFATRIALGATRTDVVRQALLDGVTPALQGGCIGVFGGSMALRLFDHELLPGAAEIALSPVIVAYALGGAVFAGILAGAVALIPLRRLDSRPGIQSASKGSTPRVARLRRAFVVTQTALAFLLLNAAGTLTASIKELLRVDPGFRVNDVWTASTYLPGATLPQASDLRLAMERITLGLRGLPGVEVAGGGSALPFSNDYDDNVIFAEGYTMRPGESAISPIRIRLSPGYLETIGVAAIKGRIFDGRDANDSARVVIVDERLAHRFWPNQNPVGRRMYYPGAPPSERLTVVGVVPSIRLEDLSGAGNPNGLYYTPWSQSASRRLSLVWRGGPETVASVRNAFSRWAPGSALFEVRSMRERQELTLAARRTAQSLLLAFAGVAVLLTAVGINGLFAFLVMQRHREIGIRLAIGSRPSDVFRLFLSDGAGLIAVGLILGLVAATILKPLVAGQFYGVAAIEPLVFAGTCVSIALISLIAISLPAIRAARVDPIRTLREN